MSVNYYEKERIWKLDTKSTSYVIGEFDKEHFVGHIYYGRKLKQFDLSYLLGGQEARNFPSKTDSERVSFMGSFPFEYPVHGLGDLKEEALTIKTAKGHSVLQLSYESHRIYKGKEPLTGLPATFGKEDEVESLELTCVDPILNVRVLLKYSAFYETDVITRSVKVQNNNDSDIFITRIMSSVINMDYDGYDVITQYGTWGREGNINRFKLPYGNHNVASTCGKTSHEYQPFIALCSHNTDENHGKVYAFHFVYSGNFLAQATRGFGDSLRVSMGINPSDFTWKLEPGESFEAPEVVHTYTEDGLGQMSRNLHDQYRSHLIRSPYLHKKRPVLINNWEATYFNFDTEKLLSIARQASELGIEMLVMDDGWFGKRNNDSCSLGDWYVNEDKLKGGLPYLVSEVNKLGMKFGIWFEPEMVCPDSDLYRAHPDYAIQVPGRRAGLKRSQYVLDFTRKEVVDAVFKMISDVLNSCNIEYVKWDMNRILCDLGSIGLPADRQGELLHRYMLGVYEIQERLITAFPNLLLENCSSGGGRFDPGMLYYSPQIWTSDDTDAMERLVIQEGAAMLYPLSSMGAHVSDCPNHITGRTVPFETRGYVALAGTFGYELDVTKIPEEDRKMIPKQVEEYHKYNDLVREGDYYRLESFSKNQKTDAYMVVKKDKSEALVTVIHVFNRPVEGGKKIKLNGLKPDAMYRINDDKRIYSGEELMYIGIHCEAPWAGGDFNGKLYHITEVK